MRSLETTNGIDIPVFRKNIVYKENNKPTIVKKQVSNRIYRPLANQQTKYSLAKH